MQLLAPAPLLVAQVRLINYSHSNPMLYITATEHPLYVMLHPAPNESSADDPQRRRWWSAVGERLPGMLYRGECDEVAGRCDQPLLCNATHPQQWRHGDNLTTTHVCQLDAIQTAFHHLPGRPLVFVWNGTTMYPFDAAAQPPEVPFHLALLETHSDSTASSAPQESRRRSEYEVGGGGGGGVAGGYGTEDSQ